MRYFFVSYTFIENRPHMEPRRLFWSQTFAKERYPNYTELENNFYEGSTPQSVWSEFDILNIQELSEADYHDFIGEKT